MKWKRIQAAGERIVRVSLRRVQKSKGGWRECFPICRSSSRASGLRSDRIDVQGSVQLSWMGAHSKGFSPWVGVTTSFSFSPAPRPSGAETVRLHGSSCVCSGGFQSYTGGVSYACFVAWVRRALLFQCGDCEAPEEGKRRELGV